VALPVGMRAVWELEARGALKLLLDDEEVERSLVCMLFALRLQVCSFSISAMSSSTSLHSVGCRLVEEDVVRVTDVAWGEV
jgi:hypothetical protein